MGIARLTSHQAQQKERKGFAGAAQLAYSAEMQAQDLVLHSSGSTGCRLRILARFLLDALLPDSVSLG